MYVLWFYIVEDKLWSEKIGFANVRSNFLSLVLKRLFCTNTTIMNVWYKLISVYNIAWLRFWCLASLHSPMSSLFIAKYHFDMESNNKIVYLVLEFSTEFLLLLHITNHICWGKCNYIIWDVQHSLWQNATIITMSLIFTLVNVEVPTMFQTKLIAFYA